MGDARKDALRVEFDSRIKLEFHGAAITSDAGLIAYRELDEALKLTEMGEVFRDSRRGKNTQHELIGLLRQSVYSRLAGYEDTNNAERLTVDSVMRQVIGGRARDRQDTSTSQNMKSLMDLPGMWIDRVRQHRSLDKLIFDLDSSVSEAYGRQEGSAYNLGNFLLRLVLPRPMKTWTMTTLRKKLIKIGAKVVRHAKYVTFQMAEVAVPCRLYRAILERIRRLAALSPRAAPI